MKRLVVPFFLLPLVAMLSLHGEEDSLSAQTAKTATVTIVQRDARFSPFTGSITGNRVRLRTAPALDGSVVRETAPGELFAVVGEQGDFYQVTPPKETKGYVFRTFVLEGVVEGERVNVRLYPDIEAPIVGRLNSGQKIDATISAVNNKWLELNLEDIGHFYVSKAYVEKVGPAEMLAERENRHNEAWHLLSTAFHYAQSEIQRPFEEIDLERVSANFEKLVTDYADFDDIIEKAKEMNHLIQDIYLQRKISFLELKADRTMSCSEDEIRQSLKSFAALGEPFGPSKLDEEVLFAQFSDKSGSTPATDEVVELTDKMRVWQPLEESLYKMWSAVNSEQTTLEFYEDEKASASVLTGIVEPYERPVKNRPGDFLLKIDNRPVAFLYSTKVNLQENVGKQVTLMAAPRPNNNFAFPAYFVLSVE